MLTGNERSISFLYLMSQISMKRYSYKSKTYGNEFELLERCKKEIQNLLDKKLIRPSKSPWSCAAFYVNNAAEQEQVVPRLVINYKPLNKVLQWIHYPISNKRDLLNQLFNAKIFLSLI